MATNVQRTNKPRLATDGERRNPLQIVRVKALGRVRGRADGPLRRFTVHSGPGKTLRPHWHMAPIPDPALALLRARRDCTSARKRCSLMRPPDPGCPWPTKSEWELLRGLSVIDWLARLGPAH